MTKSKKASNPAKTLLTKVAPKDNYGGDKDGHTNSEVGPGNLSKPRSRAYISFELSLFLCTYPQGDIDLKSAKEQCSARSLLSEDLLRQRQKICLLTAILHLSFSCKLYIYI